MMYYILSQVTENSSNLVNLDYSVNTMSANKQEVVEKFRAQTTRGKRLGYKISGYIDEYFRIWTIYKKKGRTIRTCFCDDFNRGLL